jgi:hypothetical protein
VDFEDPLHARGVCDDEDVAFFADADLVADAVDGGFALVSVKGKIVQSTVGEAVAIVGGVFETSDQADFGQGGDAAVRGGAEGGELGY